jgi:hypothetical protein
MRYSLILFSLLSCSLSAQDGYWQQKVNYVMDIDVDANANRFTGKQVLTYTNNSPDVLNKVFYHLYFNAFQPGSAMDVRSRLISDPDQRVRDRIFKLKPEEIGYHHIKSLTQNGKPVSYEIEGTIVEVTLNQAIPPKGQAIFEMEFESQVPLQIRRSGRDNQEGIRLSCSQWYPKMTAYDQQGWHADPYVGREFYGEWGDFEVKIRIDSSYTLAATGYLQNPQEIGKGYTIKGKPVKRPVGNKLTWHFKAPQVHDFMWAADPDYVHLVRKEADLPELHFFYQPDVAELWKQLPEYMVRSFRLMNEKFGKYPYEQFSFVQGGDGGMEYPMATLILGKSQRIAGLVGLAVHESIHNWFYGVLGNNESLYPWMDEGFTSYAEDYVMDKLFDAHLSNPQVSNYQSYFDLVSKNLQEPLSTHADHFNTNRGYSASSYGKGAVFLHQLSYIIGQENFQKGMLEYFNTWKFKHPTPNDLKRIMEKISGLELDWYLEYWIYTTKTIDYGIKAVSEKEGKTQVLLERIELMPMPIDVQVTFKGGRQEMYTIPLDIMRGAKKEGNARLLSDWGWVYPEYAFTLPVPVSEIEKIQIDPSERLADIEPDNNTYPSPVPAMRKDVGIEGKVK